MKSNNLVAKNLEKSPSARALIGNSLEAQHDTIVNDDSTKAGSMKIGSPVEPIAEVDRPSEKIHLQPSYLPRRTPQVMNSMAVSAMDSPRTSTNSDWEQETSKALENIMSPLSSHPVSTIKPGAPSPKLANTRQVEIPTKSSTTSRPPTAPSAPIIKPGGFQRLSAASPQHSKKDSGAGFEVSSRDGSKAEMSGELVSVDSGNTDEEITPTKKKEKGLLRILKLQKA